jgi:hypothetical protein
VIVSSQLSAREPPGVRRLSIVFMGDEGPIDWRNRPVIAAILDRRALPGC